jgi:hypothetical protein
MMLGVCGSIATACALLLLEEIFRMQKQERTINSVDGLLQRSSSSSFKENEEAYITKRDMALAIAAFGLVASFSLESFRSDGFTYQPGIGIYDHWGPDWKVKQHPYNIGRDVVGVVGECGKAITLLATVSLHFSFAFNDNALSKQTSSLVTRLSAFKYYSANCRFGQVPFGQ